ncbi:hypothetical protein KKG63_03610 [Patescibacteria group bacterium]|nr:hypothetical protein [Patescibacteria group bacterium]MBU1999472.1 hypothetical protein [Candidatus Omnitrophota bacterium]
MVNKIGQEQTIETNRITEFRKVDEERQIVWGVVYEPDKVDTQGDFASAEEIEKAAHQFLEGYNQVGLMHNESLSKKANVVENYLAPIDFILGEGKVKKGAWVMAVHIVDNDIWEQVKKGELNAFSMGGISQRR